MNSSPPSMRKTNFEPTTEGTAMNQIYSSTEYISTLSKGQIHLHDFVQELKKAVFTDEGRDELEKLLLHADRAINHEIRSHIDKQAIQIKRLSD